MPRALIFCDMANDRSIPIDRVVRGDLARRICKFFGYLFKRIQNGCVQDNRIDQKPSGLALKLGDGCNGVGIGV